MSWVSEDDRAYFCNTSEENWGIKTQYDDEVHGFLAESLYGEFDFALLIVDDVTSCTQADAFFTTSEWGPALYIFASRDETCVGRCIAIQRYETVVAMTIVHAHLELEDVEAIMFEMHEQMHKWAAMKKSMAKVSRALEMFDEYHDVCWAASELKHDIVELLLQRFLARHLRRVIHPRLQDGDVFGTLPNLITLLAEAPGPIEAIHNTPGGVCGATIMGGSVAILCAQTDGDERMAACQMAFDHVGARIVFVVSQHVCAMPDFETSAGSCYPTTPVLVIDVRGVPVAHVAHVIEVASSLAMTDLRGIRVRPRGVCTPELKKLLTHACTDAVELQIQALRTARADAMRVIERAVDANLGGIKARLWRPDGRLASRMISGWGADTT